MDEQVDTMSKNCTTSKRVHQTQGLQKCNHGKVLTFCQVRFGMPWMVLTFISIPMSIHQQMTCGLLKSFTKPKNRIRWGRSSFKIFQAAHMLFDKKTCSPCLLFSTQKLHQTKKQQSLSLSFCSKVNICLLPLLGARKVFPASRSSGFLQSSLRQVRSCVSILSSSRAVISRSTTSFLVLHFL